MVSGAIAYAVLKQDSPQAVDKVVALLKKHPYYEQEWKEKIEESFVPAGDRDLYLFMLAARWADDARDDHDFYPPGLHRDRDHYINIPLKPSGQPEWVEVAPPDEINLFRAYEVHLAKLSGNAPDEEKVVSLTWLFHLIGDVHQPLHTASYFTTRFQRENGHLIGDRGGTHFYIRARPGSAPISLHTFWDGLIIGSERFQSTRNRAIELRNRPDFARDRLEELTVTDFEKWGMKESFELARTVAYRHGAADLDGSATRTLAPVLPADYVGKVQPIAERRVVLAGYRLAAVLKKVVQ
jgi:hypothetical protein